MNSATFFASFVSLVVGIGGTSAYYEKGVAEVKAEQAEALRAAHEQNEKGLADATNTILLAQAEYNGIRVERDRLLARLRNQNNRAAKNGSSCDALGARIADLESMVERLSESAAKCDDGWQRCAQKHDALAETLK